MAITAWVGGVDGNWSTAGNWSNGAAGAGDTAIITGANSITGGLDQSAVALAKLIISEGCTASIGTSGSPLIIDVAVDVGEVFMAGTGTIVHLSGDFPKVYVNRTGSAADAFKIKGQGTNVDDLFIARGNVTIAGSGTIVDTYVNYFTNALNDVQLTIEAGCTLTNLNTVGGRTSTLSGVTTLNCYGGEVSTLASCSDAITTINVFGGTVKHGSTGTVTTVNGYAGTFDASGNHNSRTITTINRYGPCAMWLRNPGLIVTNNVNNYWQHGRMDIMEGAIDLPN